MTDSRASIAASWHAGVAIDDSFPARCPHTLRASTACSQCIGVVVERHRYAASVDEITAAPKPKRVHWRVLQKRQAAARERQARERAARRAYASTSIITARREP